MVGSSPRLWGTQVRKAMQIARHRFIPTPVGNTSRPNRRRRHLPVHPHACGEHARASTQNATVTGSSPRLWGTLDLERQFPHKARFIPTPVGNTAPRPTSRPCIPVHPHACGEHTFPAVGALRLAGSSPRLWGTPKRIFQDDIGGRFIPTPVGNTSIQLVMGLAGSVHPHACGEHLLGRGVERCRSGSSPRLWGTLHAQKSLLAPHRFIPTPVGNTSGIKSLSI